MFISIGLHSLNPPNKRYKGKHYMSTVRGKLSHQGHWLSFLESLSKLSEMDRDGRNSIITEANRKGDQFASLAEYGAHINDFVS